MYANIFFPREHPRDLSSSIIVRHWIVGISCLLEFSRIESYQCMMKGFLVLPVIFVLSSIPVDPIIAYESCPPGFTGYLEYTYSCYQFLQCDRGGTFLMNCGPGTAFNPSLSVCDWPQNIPRCGSGEGLIDIR